jgi:UDP-4-amino-4,6-dideoxy-N-acetyl-beta-L-altrosamine N-acetyltransferase
MLTRRECILRPVEEKDLERILGWRNSGRIRSSMYTDHVITWEEHLRWFERLQGERRGLSLIFEVSGKAVGIVNVSRMDRVNNTCHWGFYLGDTDAPRGCGTIMGFLGLEYLFEKLNIRKVIGEAFVFNQASIAFHEKLGFSREGHFRRHVLKNDKYEDIFAFALFKEQWTELKPELERKLFLRTEQA